MAPEDDARYRSLFDNLPIGLYRTTPDGRFLDVNAALVQMLGYPSREELLRAHPSTVWASPQERSQFVARLEREGVARDFEMRVRRLDGALLWVRSSVCVIRERDAVWYEGAVLDITARKLAENALQDSEERHRLLLEFSPVATIVHSGGRLAYANAAAVALFGAQRAAEIVGRAVLDLVHPDSRAEVVARIRRVTESHEPAPAFAERLVGLDGRVIEAEVSGIPVDDRGRPGVLAVIRDVTEHKRAQRALRESEERFRQMAETIPEVFWIADPVAHRLLYVSPAFASVWGPAAHPPYAEPRRLLETVLPEDREALDEALASWPERAFDVDFRVRRTDESTRWVRTRAFPIRDAAGAVYRVIGVSEDITERKLAEEKLRKSEARLAEAQRIARLGNWEWDVAADHVEGSDELYRIFDVDAGPASYRALLERVHPDDRTRADAVVQKTVRERAAFDVDFRIVRRDGATTVAQSRGRVVEGADRTRLFGTVQDITERKRIEEELARARDEALQASRLKSAFLANMSHEIRTPLNVILGYNSLIADHFAEHEAEGSASIIDGLSRAGKRLMDTVHGILDLSTIETDTFDVRPSVIELGPLVERQVADFQLLAARKRLTLSCRIEEPAAVWFDEYCLLQALTNLLANAIKFTERGAVSVRVFRDGDGSLTLEVADTGIGIDESFLPRLFDPFSQEHTGYDRAFEGSGLGLALTRKYVELNGATISVSSRKGSGSVFRIRLPEIVERRASGAASRR